MLDNSLFYANLVAKGRMKSLLSAIPVYIVTHPQVRLHRQIALRFVKSSRFLGVIFFRAHSRDCFLFMFVHALSFFCDFFLLNRFSFVFGQVGLLGAQVMTLRLLEQEGKKVTVVASCEKEADAARGMRRGFF
jgi:hypothetical protein